jgi:hypothetical protein
MSEKAEAGPSTSLRFAQDDKLFVIAGNTTNSDEDDE